MKRITDPTFVYVPSAETDLKKRFDAIYRAQRVEAKAKADQEARNRAEADAKTIIYPRARSA